MGCDLVAVLNATYSARFGLSFLIAPGDLGDKVCLSCTCKWRSIRNI